jgi:hypothetical protein
MKEKRNILCAFVSVCTPEQFTCRLINECVDISLKCDNKKDCKDGTDEWFDCSPSSTPSPPPRGKHSVVRF